jgi:hypothetical protein
MAKRRRKINKSQAIRDYLAKNPSATPSVIQEALAKKGLKVGASLISQVKYKPSASKGRRKKRGRPARASASGRRIGLAQLVEAKALADKMGGVARARQALDMLAKLT